MEGSSWKVIITDLAGTDRRNLSDSTEYEVVYLKSSINTLMVYAQ